ncbi:MAG TPA: TrmH family RNA methyltransferase, partial [Candidatus Paceibacterota bacterium]|nr:TrmH family RNA methyltransferase [Candidatus Paceibacterota bacterium]
MQVKNVYAAINTARLDGCKIIAIEQDARAASLFDFKADPKQKLALVLGNEVRGISKATLAKCDQILEIPMRGKKESLNVSVAAGIAMFMLIQR